MGFSDFARAAALLAALTAGAAWAHSGATGLLKQRMDNMKAISDATKALGAVKAGAIPFSVETIRLAAGDIARHTAIVAEQFPHGSNVAPSEALDIIWTDRAGFDQLMEKMRLAAERLAATADDDAATIALMDEIGATCKDCHATYRKP